MTELEQKVCTAFTKVASADSKEKITLDALIDDLGMDSLDVFELLMDLDETFGTELEIEHFSLCDRIGDVCNEISKQLSHRQAQ